MTIPDEDDASKIRRLGRALTSVGEAYFFFAEEKREDVEKIKFPNYKGPGSKEAVLKHIKGPVRRLDEEEAPAIENAQSEYIKIVELKPTPPPMWVIAAGSQVGGLWGNFVREFRAAPIPTDIKKDTELRNTYYEALDSASEPDKLKAKAAFEYASLLRQIPVLRRVLAKVRALALQDLQERVSPDRRVSRVARTTSAAG